MENIDTRMWSILYYFLFLLQVGWDESTACERQRRVSLWEIEPLTTFLVYPPTTNWRLKHPWPQPVGASFSSGNPPHKYFPIFLHPKVSSSLLNDYIHNNLVEVEGLYCSEFVYMEDISTLKKHYIRRKHYSRRKCFL